MKIRDTDIELEDLTNEYMDDDYSKFRFVDADVTDSSTLHFRALMSYDLLDDDLKIYLNGYSLCPFEEYKTPEGIAHTIIHESIHKATYKVIFSDKVVNRFKAIIHCHWPYEKGLLTDEGYRKL